jgi:hypothetical protein
MKTTNAPRDHLDRTLTAPAPAAIVAPLLRGNHRDRSVGLLVRLRNQENKLKHKRCQLPMIGNLVESAPRSCLEGPVRCCQRTLTLTL